MDKHPQDYLCQRSPAFGVRRGPCLGKSSDVEKGGRVISESMQQWRVGEKCAAGLPQVGGCQSNPGTDHLTTLWFAARMIKPI